MRAGVQGINGVRESQRGTTLMLLGFALAILGTHWNQDFSLKTREQGCGLPLGRPYKKDIKKKKS